MTGRESFKKALSLLGYSDGDNNPQLTGRVMNRAVPILNLVYSDMHRICGLEHTQIKSLNDNLELPEKAENVFICGLAAYIADSEGDDNKQAFWSAEYQARRTTLTTGDEIEDVLPTVGQ